MKKIFIILGTLILLILFTFPACALNGQILITRDTACVDKWSRTPGQDTSKIPVTLSVLKKEYFWILLFPGNYKLTKNNSADVEYDLRIINPESKIYLEKQKLKAITPDMPKPGPVIPSKENLNLSFGPDDKIGDYIIEINLRDNVAKESKSLKSGVKLTDFVYHPEFNDIPSLSEWMNRYHKNPAPEKAVDAFISYSLIMLNERRASFLPTLSFFLEIFNNNKYLYPSLVNLYDSQNVTTKTCIIYLLGYANYDLGDLAKKMSKEENDTYQRLLTQKLRDPYEEIATPSQLDTLWGIFLGSGSYKPVKKIIDTLVLSEYKGYQIKYKTSEKTDDDRKKAIYDTIYQAARTSLKNNCTQYSLVKDYCVYTYENENLPELVKSELKEILGK